MMRHWPFILFSRHCKRCGLRKPLWTTYCNRCFDLLGW